MFDAPLPSLSPSPRTSVSFSSSEESETQTPSFSNILDDNSPLYAEPSGLGPSLLPPMSHKSQWPHIQGHSPASPSFLGDLYDPMHMDDIGTSNSDSPNNSAHHPYPSPPAHLFRPQEWAMGGAVHHLPDPEHHPYRRSSYPYVRQEDPHHPLAAEQGHLKMDQPMIVPTQHILPAPSSYYGQPDSRPGSSHSQMSNGGYMPQHHVMTVMHTDDAASKETQYLRRRCFNCHQTEPPSWRRSTLNPGKIVCNKCGLYERTHLRARPHRFDELRASNKARKASQQAAPYPAQAPNKVPSPKNRNLNPSSFVKKEPHEYPLPGNRSRRGSTASSTSSGLSGQSDWDENISVYNSGSSAASSAYSSPIITPYSIPQPSPSPSFDSNPNNGMSIRLPAAPMVQSPPATAGLGLNRSHTPVKSHTAPYYGVDRRGQDRRYTTGNAPTYDSPAWDSGSEKDMKSSTA